MKKLCLPSAVKIFSVFVTNREKKHSLMIIYSIPHIVQMWEEILQKETSKYLAQFQLCCR